MSIRLWPGGLSFSGHITAVDGSFFHRDVPFVRSQTYVSALKECFFANEFLSWRYKRLRVVSHSPHFLLVPNALCPTDNMVWEDWMRKAFTRPESLCLSQPLSDKRATLLFGCDEEAHAFCQRSMQCPEFTHRFVPLLAYWQQQSLRKQHRCLFAWIDQGHMDVACYDTGLLLLMNSFPVRQESDQLYYLFCVWQQAGLDTQVDQLYVHAEPSARLQLLEEARHYLRNVEGMVLPAELYLLGEEVVTAPLDIIASLLCES